PPTPVPMPRTRGDKGAPKGTETPGKGKGGDLGEKTPKTPEDGGPLATKSPSSDSRHGGHGQKNGKKGPGDPHAAATKTYSPFLNTVFGKLLDAFKEFDTDQDGYISYKDLGDTRRPGGDHGRGGRVAGPVGWVTPHPHPAPNLRVPQFDVNGDGEISSAEMREAIAALLGEQLKAQEVDEILQDVDLNGDGRVDFD
ncbi:CABP4 protein, partial [Glareola pratincola]|nr:CABP4 protein [Glareola pratincola]